MEKVAFTLGSVAMSSGDGMDSYTQVTIERRALSM
jgi:hypothetical protein